MLGKMDNDIQVAGWTALRAGFSFTLNPQPRTSFDARRNLDFHLFLALDATGAPAILTRCLYYATGAATRLAGSRYGEEKVSFKVFPLLL